MILEDKTKSYLKYAIGEILLVMIGILLAVQVNNWNEKRKLNAEITSILLVFENELIDNITQSNEIILDGYERDSLTTRYVNGKITREDLLKTGLRFLRFATMTRSYRHENLDKLIDLEKELPKKYAHLIPEFKLLKVRIESQTKWENTVIELSLERSREMADLLPSSLLEDSISKEKTLQFYLTDELHKSKLIHYNSYLLTESTWDASLIRTSAVSLLWSIQNIREPDSIKLDTFFANLNLTPFKELECSENPYQAKEKVNFRVNPIIYNHSKEPVCINFINLDGEILNSNQHCLPAGKWILSELDLPTNVLIEITDNESCNKVYRRTYEDYLVFNF